MNKSEKFADKLGLGLKFARNVDFCACNEDFNKKTEGKKCDFCCFSVTLKIAIFVVELQMLIFCKITDSLLFIGYLNWKDFLVKLCSQHKTYVVHVPDPE